MTTYKRHATLAAGKPRFGTSVFIPKCSCCDLVVCECENCIVITHEWQSTSLAEEYTHPPKCLGQWRKPMEDGNLCSALGCRNWCSECIGGAIIIEEERDLSYPLEEDVIRVHCYSGSVLNYSAEDDIKAGDKVSLRNCSAVKAKPNENATGIALDDAEFFGTIYIIYER